MSARPIALPPRPAALPVRVDGIPRSMREAVARWCVWKFVWHGEAWKKIPYRVDTPTFEAKVNDPAGWGSFSDAIRIYESQAFDGVGFLLGDGRTGVDLDDCRDPNTAALTETAVAILRQLDSYTEVSPSGTGLKIFVEAQVGRNHARAGLEIYGTARARYFAVTGHHLDGSPQEVASRASEVEALISGEFGRSTPHADLSVHRAIPGGGRNNSLASLAGRLRRAGVDHDAISAALLAHNDAHCQPPLSRAEVESIARSISRYEPAEDTFPTTEQGNAEFLAATYGEQLRFDHRRGRFLLFQEHRWKPDPGGEVQRIAVESIRRRHQATVALPEGADKKRRVTWAIQSESRQRLENAVKLARSVNPISDTGDGWDHDPWLLGVPNGVVDLRTGQLRPGRPDDRITMSAGIAYDPAATCPLWQATVEQVFAGEPELVAYVQRALGYSLTADCREECLFFCWGDGRNGKGTILNTIGWILSDYADNLSFSALELHDRSSVGNEIAKLVGKRYVTASESGEAARLNETRIKALTGRDGITARFLYQEEFTFQPDAKFWLSSNTKPVVRDQSEGFWSRLHLIPFTQSFAGREDRTLKDKLRDEAPGILAWAVRGCLAWQREGLNPPAVVRQATQAYRDESDPLADFYDTRCVITDGTRVKAATLFSEYRTWASAVGLRFPLGSKGFYQAVGRRFTRDKRNDGNWYAGIGIRDARPELRESEMEF